MTDGANNELATHRSKVVKIVKTCKVPFTFLPLLAMSKVNFPVLQALTFLSCDNSKCI